MKRYCAADGVQCMNYLGETITCKADHVLTEQKKELYTTKIIPGAVKLHAERLLVQPVAEKIELPRNLDVACQHFTIPIEHKRSGGVAGADMVLYAAAGPIGHDIPAWAATCATLEDFRPSVGAMNFNPAYMTESAWSVRVAAHGLAHALGFSHEAMGPKSLVKSEPNVRGENRKIVTGDTVKAKAVAHFNCESLKGMELEKDTVGVQAKLPHWEGRNARDELMAPTVGAGYYTALTLAVFEDLGYYRANWGMAEPMRWGNNSGCGFLQTKCNDTERLATTYPHMFCDDTDKATLRCSSDRRHVGTCTTGIVDQSGNLHFKDVCPVVSTYFYDSNSGRRSNACADAAAATLPGSLTGTNSWCLDAEELQVKTNAGGTKIEGVCAQVLCEGGAVKVKYLGAKEPVLCPEGKEVTVVANDHLQEGKLKCPKYEEVCTIAANGSSLVIPRVEEEGANGDAEGNQREDEAEQEEENEEEAAGDAPALEPQRAELPSGTAGGDPSNPKAAAEVETGTLPAAETQGRAKGPDGGVHSAAASLPSARRSPPHRTRPLPQKRATRRRRRGQ
ncbi:surface protease GP63, partial [Trypanosoma conorhini]